MGDGASASIIVTHISNDENFRRANNKKIKFTNKNKNERFDNFFKSKMKRHGGKNVMSSNGCDINENLSSDNGTSKNTGTTKKINLPKEKATNERIYDNSITNTNRSSGNSEANNMADGNEIEMVNGDFLANGQSQSSVLTTQTQQQAVIETDKNEAQFYSNNHVGDIIVLVDTSKVDNDKKMKNGLYLYEKIRDLKCYGIKNIKAVGYTLYKIFFDSIGAANSFVRNEKLSERNLRAFIPKSFVESYGVIRDVPLYLSDDDILANIKSEIKVTYVRRFKRKLRGDNSNELTLAPTYSVKIGFAGNLIPNEVVINFTILKVDMFYPHVRQCHNCGRLGHTRNACKSKKRCLSCGKDGQCDGACGTIKCLLCGGEDHRANEKNKCSKWLRETEINKIMTAKKMSKREVLETYSQSHENRYDILADNEHFPVLKSNTSKVRDMNKVVNSILTPRRYSTVVRQVPKPPVMKPHFDRPERMFREAGPSQPVYNDPNYKRVSDLEKITTEILKFMKDHFTNVSNPIGLEAVNHFTSRINKIAIDLDHQLITQSQSFHDEDFTI